MGGWSGKGVSENKGVRGSTLDVRGQRRQAHSAKAEVELSLDLNMLESMLWGDERAKQLKFFSSLLMIFR
jgi:hypothetical protein